MRTSKTEKVWSPSRTGVEAVSVGEASTRLRLRSNGAPWYAACLAAKPWTSAPSCSAVSEGMKSCSSPCSSVKLITG